MWTAGLDEAQAGIKIAGRNINNPRYKDDTTLMAESEEELKSLLMKVKEKNEKAGKKFFDQVGISVIPGILRKLAFTLARNSYTPVWHIWGY